MDTLSGREVFEFPTFYMWLDEEGNVCVLLKENYRPSSSIEDVRNYFEELEQILQGRNANFIFFTDRAKPSKRAIRDYIQEHLWKYVNAFAFVGTKPMTRMIVNLFFAFQKPPYPSAIFSTEEKAKEWLRKHPVKS